MTATTVVFGIGHPDRADDAVGPAVAERVAARDLPGVSVVPLVTPLELIDAWTGCDIAVVVDAARTGSPDGSVTVHRVRDVSWPASSRALNTHALGLVDAIELARALDQLPRELVVVGIEAGNVQIGAPMSAPTRAAIDAGVDAVIGALSQCFARGRA